MATTMQDTPSWMLLKQLAQNDTDASARKLANLFRRRCDAEAQLKMLQDYRADYRARLDGATRNGIGGEGLRNFRIFLGNLETAIEQQSHTVAALREELHAAKAAWHEDKRRADSYQILDDRQTVAARRVEERRQQALQDEIAVHAYLKRTTRRK